MKNSSTASGKMSPVIAYAGAAMALSRAIRQNKRDCDTARDDIQISYFVDANIPLWYLKVEDNYDLVAPLAAHEETQDVTLVESGSSIIASEYIFSEALVGSKGFAPILAPPHADDLQGQIHRLGRDLIEEWRKAGDTRILRTASSNLTDAIMNFKQNSSIEALSALFKAFSAVTKITYGKAAMSQQRMARLFGQRRVVRVDPRVDFDLDVSRSSDEAINGWKTRLINAGKPDVEQTLSRDAEALFLLETLNRDAREKNKPIYYVMITADKDLHECVDRWQRSGNDQDPRTVDFLRHPRQYVPILNLKSMRPGAKDEIEGFDNLMLSVENVMAFVAAQYQKQPGATDIPISHDIKANVALLSTHIHDKKTFDLEQLEKSSGRVPDLSRQWREALETSILVNAVTVLGTADKLIREHIAPLGDQTVDTALRKDVEERIVRIGEAHTGFAAQGLLDLLLRDADHHGRLLTRSRRLRVYRYVPMLTRIPIPKVIADKLVHDDHIQMTELGSLADALIKGDDDGLRQSLNEIRQRLEGVDAARLACLMSFHVGRWNQARDFAEQIIRAIPSQPQEQAEFRYIELVARRFGGLTLEVLQQSRRALEQQARDFSSVNDAFGEARALSEQAAQCLLFAYAQEIEVEPCRRVPSTYTWRVVIDAENYLERARKRTRDGSQGTRPGEQAEQARKLRRQILSNTLSAYFFGVFSDIAKEAEYTKQDAPPPAGIAEELLRPPRLTHSRHFRPSVFYALCAQRRLGGTVWTAREDHRLKTMLRIFEPDTRPSAELERNDVPNEIAKEVLWLLKKLGLSSA
jgi:hypothetical protein